MNRAQKVKVQWVTKRENEGKCGTDIFTVESDGQAGGNSSVVDDGRHSEKRKGKKVREVRTFVLIFTLESDGGRSQKPAAAAMAPLFSSAASSLSAHTSKKMWEGYSYIF